MASPAHGLLLVPLPCQRKAVYATNQPKLHHFLPEAYLRRFDNEGGDLWVLDRKLGVVRRQSPEVTAAEREMYTVEDDCGERTGASNRR